MAKIISFAQLLFRWSLSEELKSNVQSKSCIQLKFLMSIEINGLAKVHLITLTVIFFSDQTYMFETLGFVVAQIFPSIEQLVASALSLIKQLKYGIY